MTEDEFKERYPFELNNPRNNVYSRPDLQAWRQSIELAGSFYKVIRNTINEYDEKGRPNNKQEVQYIAAAIIPVGDYSVTRKGQGSWTSEKYKISYVYPDYLRIEDIVEHPNYGVLKVLEVDDMREYGISTATAVRINSIRRIKDNGEWL